MSSGHTRASTQTTLLLILVTLVAAAVTALTVGTAKAAPGGGTGASFVVECGINGVFDGIDPIAFTDHKHVESGADPFTNDITARSVRDNETTCVDPKDKTAYWSPQLYEDSGDPLKPTPLEPTRSTIYYRGGVAPSSVVAFPFSAKMLANEPSKVNWECRTAIGVQQLDNAPTTCAGTLVAIIHFPQCWNGDAPALVDDFAYPRAEECPAPYSKVVPAMTQRWSFTAPDGVINGLKVSAGNDQFGDQSFEHADFLNGWIQTRLKFLIQDCIKGVPQSEPRPDRCRLIDPTKL